MTNRTELLSFSQVQALDSVELRLVIRRSKYKGHTAGLALGFLQANLVILPANYALDFMRFCQRNMQACPVVGISDTGSPAMQTFARGLDLRTDLPSYNIYRHGELTEQRTQIGDLWSEDFVAFALGCSFTFEQALMREGIALQHVVQNTTVPMYRTNIACNRAGDFQGKLVVSMRAISPKDLDRVRAVCRNYPHAHGEPVHWGEPADIGITDINRPDWGDAIEIPSDCLSVFWACGVTSQNALIQAKPSLCITHTPGHMLVADVPEDLVPPMLTDAYSSDLS